jgi:enoyl-CoA hydratase/carnithine racemase
MKKTSSTVWGAIELTAESSYAIIRIARESKRNAMDRSARKAMLCALEYAQHKFPVIVLTGNGSAFCAGIDLKERDADISAGIHTPTEEWAAVNVAIRQHPSIFIAAVNGTALGGGGTLINVCDLAIAVDTAEIGLPEITFGAYPGLAGPSLQLTINRKRAAWMMLTGNRISAKTALEWGLINEIVPPDKLMSRAESLATHISKFDKYALGACKQSLDAIPSTITDWRQAFQYGTLLNASIRLRTTSQ